MDRYNFQSQLEHLQSKYIGTGHSDTTKFEWLVNQHRSVHHLWFMAIIANIIIIEKAQLTTF